ncbi:hypothetical protein [Chryseobacterium sp. MP_3.2]|uniref:hypothetical protein n=1 Tax=Chryseobacterium sp. MP_3.2 TaxID=3071712 RepID=UPI002E091302|nr:hypothetical protein [Chryseobacterium sp. MP_3.2]
MLNTFSKKQIYIFGALILLLLNTLAFYSVKQSIGIIEALQKVQNEAAIQSLQQKSFFYNAFSAIVITLDLIAILFAFYLLHKLIFKTLKNFLSTK